MKEAIGESSMTLITIVLVGAALSAIAVIVGFLLTNQSNRSKCENAGGNYKNGACVDYNGDACSIIDDEYNCG